MRALGLRTAVLGGPEVRGQTRARQRTGNGGACLGTLRPTWDCLLIPSASVQGWDADLNRQIPCPPVWRSLTVTSADTKQCAHHGGWNKPREKGAQGQQIQSEIRVDFLRVVMLGLGFEGKGSSHMENWRRAFQTERAWRPKQHEHRGLRQPCGSPGGWAGGRGAGETKPWGAAGPNQAKRWALR